MDGGCCCSWLRERHRKDLRKKAEGGEKKKKQERAYAWMSRAICHHKKKYNTGFLKCKNRSQKRHVLMN